MIPAMAPVPINSLLFHDVESVKIYPKVSVLMGIPVSNSISNLKLPAHHLEYRTDLFFKYGKRISNLPMIESILDSIPSVQI